MKAEDQPQLAQPGQGQVAPSQITPSTRPPPRKRNRQALSCTACRERKIKCDRTVPCSQCVKRGDQQFCRIEQKPKIVHDNAKKKQQQQQQQYPQLPQPSEPTRSASEQHTSASSGPLSPGALAYSQFSEAVSGATGSAFSSTSPSPAEVEAIKARLAMLESMLQGQQQPQGISATGLSPSNGISAGSSTSPSSTSWAQRSSGSSPISNFSINGNAAARSGSLGAFSHSSGSNYHNANSDSEEDVEHLANITQRPFQNVYHSLPQPTNTTHFLPPQIPNMPRSRKDFDSDTEDAATVLEKLAMGDGPRPVKKPGPGECPRSGGGAGGAGGSHPDGEGEGPTIARCLSKDKERDLMTLDDPANDATGAKFERCLAKDKAMGIMTEKDGQVDCAMFERCVAIEGSPDNQQGHSHINTISVSAPGAPSAEVVVQDSVPSVGQPGQEQGPVHAGIGGPECYCGPQCREDSQSPHTHEVPDAGKGEAHSCPSDPSKTTGDTCAPITEACRLACRNDGLLRLKNGPETLLGWGMGWAWASGEALLRDDMKKAEQEDRPFIATERTEREAILRAICLSLPTKEVASQLVEVYETRVRYLSGHVVHIPCLKREMEAFYALDSVEKRARVVNFVDPGWLAMFLAILALGLRFYPCKPKSEWVSVKHLFDGKTIHAWHSAAKTCLVLAGLHNSTSMSVLQTILLLYLYTSGQGSSCGGETDAGSTSTALIRIGITNAQEMGLHRLGDFDKRPTLNEPSSKAIRREIAKRVWWGLVTRDWCAAGSGCSKDYVVNPDHFNTPFPGNYNDEDLLTTPLPPPRPREEFTEMSYVLANIEVCLVIREDVDIRHRRDIIAATDGSDRRLTCAESRKLDQMYRNLLENAPSFFKVGSEIGRVTCIEVQRWLLQQGVFSKLLRIHRPNLSSREESRTNCVLLARSILDMQKKIRSRCTVIDRLWLNLMQSFSAAIVLALHLLHTRPQPEHRESVRSEITEAIAALKQIDGSDCTAKKCIRVIEALLTEEEERWKAGNDALAASQSKDANELGAQDQANHKRKRQLEPVGSNIEAETSGPGRRKNLLSLAQRVATAARGEEARAQELLQQEAKSKRVAGMGAFPNATAVVNQLPANGMSWNSGLAGVHTMKDDASSMLMNTLTLPNPGPSPIPFLMGEQAPVPDGSDVQFPVMSHTTQHQQPMFDFSSLNTTGLATMPGNNTARTAPPNGVDVMFNNPITPPDGQSFDLAAFLEQCENSPGSSSDGSLPTGQDDQQQPSRQQSIASMDTFNTASQGAQSTPGSSGSDVAPTSMDSFWNWILTQGPNAGPAPQAGGNTGSAVNAAATATAPASGQAAPAPAASSQSAMVSAVPATSAAINPSLFTGLTPFFNPSQAGYFPSSTGVPTSGQVSATMGVPIFQVETPFKPTSAATAAPTTTSLPATSNAFDVQSPPIGSVGTPSAGFAADSLLGAAPLYDFTDYANAWTASNPAAVPTPSQSRGPVISDP